MIQNMLLGGGGGDAEIKTLTATSNGGEIGFEVDGVPTWFLLYAAISSSTSHLVMAYDEVDLRDSGEDYGYGRSTNSYYISSYGAVSLKDDRPVEYWYENGTFWLRQYGIYNKIPDGYDYVLCYTT